jgi:hypothetical protein
MLGILTCFDPGRLPEYLTSDLERTDNLDMADVSFALSCASLCTYWAHTPFLSSARCQRFDCSSSPTNILVLSDHGCEKSHATTTNLTLL